MKTLSVLTIVAAMAFVALAQKAENNTDQKLRARNAPDVFVYSASAFGPDKKGDSNFTIEVGNTGAKTITAIEWEYFSREAAGQAAQDTRSFRNHKLRLRPDERSKLTQQVSHYTDKFVTGFNLETIRIKRVEYEDGSWWQRPADEK